MAELLSDMKSKMAFAKKVTAETPETTTESTAAPSSSVTSRQYPEAGAAADAPEGSALQTDTVPDVKGGASDLKAQAEEAGEGLGEEAEGASTKAKTELGAIKDVAKEHLQPEAERLKHDTSEVYARASDAASARAEAAKTTLQKHTAAAKTATKDVAEKHGQHAQGLLEGLAAHASGIMGAVGERLDSILHSGVAVVAEASRADVDSPSKGGIQDGSAGAALKRTGDKTVEAYNATAGDAVQGLAAVDEHAALLADVACETGHELGDRGHGAVDTAVDEAQSKIESEKRLSHDEAGRLVQQSRETGHRQVDALAGAAAHAGHLAGDNVKEHAEAGKQRDISGDVTDAISSVKGNADDAVTSAADTAHHAADSAGSKTYSLSGTATSEAPSQVQGGLTSATAGAGDGDGDTPPSGGETPFITKAEDKVTEAVETTGAAMAADSEESGTGSSSSKGQALKDKISKAKGDKMTDDQRAAAAQAQDMVATRSTEAKDAARLAQEHAEELQRDAQAAAHETAHAAKCGAASLKHTLTTAHKAKTDDEATEVILTSAERATKGVRATTTEITGVVGALKEALSHTMDTGKDVVVKGVSTAEDARGGRGDIGHIVSVARGTADDATSKAKQGLTAATGSVGEGAGSTKEGISGAAEGAHGAVQGFDEGAAGPKVEGVKQKALDRTSKVTDAAVSKLDEVLPSSQRKAHSAVDTAADTLEPRAHVGIDAAATSLATGVVAAGDTTHTAIASGTSTLDNASEGIKTTVSAKMVGIEGAAREKEAAAKAKATIAADAFKIFMGEKAASSIGRSGEGSVPPG